MLTLRPYQQAAIASIYGYFEKESGNPLVVIPTGGGKSLLLATLCQELLTDYPSMRIGIVTHVKELVEQNFQMARALGDRVAVMDDGRVVHAGAMAELADDEALQQRLLGLSLGAHQ